MRGTIARPQRFDNLKRDALGNFAIDFEIIVLSACVAGRTRSARDQGADESQNASSDSKRSSFLKFEANAELNARRPREVKISVTNFTSLREAAKRQSDPTMKPVS
jgi:hypothetical protein